MAYTGASRNVDMSRFVDGFSGRIAGLTRLAEELGEANGE